MKFLIWTLTGFLALLWTGAAAVLAGGVNWLAASIAQPATSTLPSTAPWLVPDWVAVWMPPGVIELLKAGIAGPLESLVGAATWIGPMLGWLPPLIWGLWGLVLVLLLALAAGIHLLVTRSTRPAA